MARKTKLTNKQRIKAVEEYLKVEGRKHSEKVRDQQNNVS